jgi:UDP-2,3-diacylglucosamine pyrophosphatase LpxH
MRLNRKELSCGKGKDYARLMLFSDLHIGHPQCDLERAKEYLDWALKNGVYVLCLGDMIEAGLTTSIGDSVYQQKLNPQEQMEAIVELLMPLAKAGLIIGYHDGNHSTRIKKATSVDVSKIIAKLLGVAYCGYALWHMLTVGSQKYTIYATHGHGGARFKHTKIKAAMDLAHWIDADLIAFGHVHSLASEVIIKQSVNTRQRTVAERECHVVLTGSYLQWEKSYAQAHGYPISKLGSPTVKLMSDRKNISVAL